MAFPISVTYTFGTQTGSVPLSYLDTNFNNLVTGVNAISTGGNALATPNIGAATGTSLSLTNALGIGSGGTGQTTANAAFNALAPSQTGNSGKYLTTDGTNTSWATNPLGTVTSVSALTLGTTGTDLSSTVANSTTTPVITLNVPTASATNRGVLSSADWTTFNSKGNGTVTNVSWTGGIVSVATSTTTPAFTIAGTSGGIPYFSSGTTWASSAVLASNALMVGGGAGVAPSTVTTGTGVVTALGVNTGTAGSFVVNGGVLGTPSSGTVTNLTGTASININGTVGATTASTGAFTTLSASSTVSGTGFSTYLASPPAIGGTASNTGKFTSLEMTSVTDTSSLARNAGRTANTTVTNTTTYTTGGLTLPSQTAAVGSSWRIRAFGQFTAANSATARNAQIACFWGTTQLTAITPAVLISTAQTTQWQVEFVLTASSATAIWTTGTLLNQVASATALAINNATSASTTVTSGAQTLDLRVSMSASVAGDSWIVQQLIFERLE